MKEKKGRFKTINQKENLNFIKFIAGLPDQIHKETGKGRKTQLKLENELRKIHSETPKRIVNDTYAFSNEGNLYNYLVNNDLLFLNLNFLQFLNNYSSLYFHL